MSKAAKVLHLAYALQCTVLQNMWYMLHCSMGIFIHWSGVEWTLSDRDSAVHAAIYRQQIFTRAMKGHLLVCLCGNDGVISSNSS